MNDTIWTKRLQWMTAVVAAFTTIGTALVLGYVTPQTMGELTEMPAADIPGFLLGFRAVGIAFLLANAVSMLALWGKSWLYYLALLTNAGQGAGIVMVNPDSMGLRDLAVVGTYMCDGLGALTALVLLVFLVRYRRSWARTAAT